MGKSYTKSQLHAELARFSSFLARMRHRSFRLAAAGNIIAQRSTNGTIHGRILLVDAGKCSRWHYRTQKVKN